MRGLDSVIGGSALYCTSSALNLDPASPQQQHREVDHRDIMMRHSDSSLAVSETSSDGGYPPFSDVEQV